MASAWPLPGAGVWITGGRAAAGLPGGSTSIPRRGK